MQNLLFCVPKAAVLHGKSVGFASQKSRFRNIKLQLPLFGRKYLYRFNHILLSELSNKSKIVSLVRYYNPCILNILSFLYFIFLIGRILLSSENFIRSSLFFIFYLSVSLFFRKKRLFLQKHQNRIPMSTIALLTLNGHNYDIRLLNQSFGLPVGWNGFPKHSLAGDGQLRILMDTPADNFILELMMKTEENPIAEGQLEIYDGTDDIPFRCIKFSKAYITEFRETFDVMNGGKMTTYVQISPMEMTINKRLDIERRLFWLWNRIPQKPMQMQEVVADPDVHINDAYWINPNGEKCREFPIGEAVKLYLVLGNYNVGQTIQFDFEEETDEGVCRASCSGRTDDKGMVIIEDFELTKKE